MSDKIGRSIGTRLIAIFCEKHNGHFKYKTECGVFFSRSVARKIIPSWFNLLHIFMLWVICRDSGNHIEFEDGDPTCICGHATERALSII